MYGVNPGKGQGSGTKLAKTSSFLLDLLQTPALSSTP